MGGPSFNEDGTWGHGGPPANGWPKEYWDFLRKYGWDKDTGWWPKWSQEAGGMEAKETELRAWLRAPDGLREEYAIYFCSGVNYENRLRSRVETLHWSLQVLAEALRWVNDERILVLQQHLEVTALSAVRTSLLLDPEQEMDILPPRLVHAGKGEAFYAYKGILSEVKDVSGEPGVHRFLEPYPDLRAILVRIDDRGMGGEISTQQADLLFGSEGLERAFLTSCVGKHEQRPFQS